MNKEQSNSWEQKNQEGNRSKTPPPLPLNQHQLNDIRRVLPSFVAYRLPSFGLKKKRSKQEKVEEEKDEEKEKQGEKGNSNVCVCERGTGLRRRQSLDGCRFFFGGVRRADGRRDRRYRPAIVTPTASTLRDGFVTLYFSSFSLEKKIHLTLLVFFQTVCFFFAFTFVWRPYRNLSEKNVTGFYWLFIRFKWLFSMFYWTSLGFTFS